MALKAKQVRFCEEYVVDFNATQAAIRAGYSKKTAYSIGSENLSKPEIKEAIKKRLAELSLTADQTSKLLSDIAQGSLNDYFVYRRVEHVPRIEIKLADHIKALEAEKIFEQEFAAQAGFSDDEKAVHDEMIKRMDRKILRHRLELKANPKAKIIVDGPVEWVEVAELDLVKLSKDKERGKIKSIKPGQFGTTVEMFGADSALVSVARIHGLFEKDNRQKGETPSLHLSDSQFDKLLNIARAASTGQGE